MFRYVGKYSEAATTNWDHIKKKEIEISPSKG